MAKCSDAMHARAMNALASLSQTQFGKAALQRHGHEPLSVEEARVHETNSRTVKGPTANG